MKMKLLMSITLLASMIACTTGTGVLNNAGYSSDHIPNTQDKSAFLASESTTPIPYACENNGKVIVNLANGSVAKINATFPDIQLINQDIRLYKEVSASGDRYVDSLNPNSTIEWHTKASEAVFSVLWSDGKTYQANCRVL